MKTLPLGVLSALAVAAIACGDSKKASDSGSGPGAEATTVPKPSGLMTSPPGTETLSLVEKLGVLHVYQFTEPGDVADQLAGYLASLATKAAKATLTIEELDPAAKPSLAKRFKISRAAIVIAKDDRFEVVRVPRQLRQLDSKMARALTKLTIEPATVVTAVGVNNKMASKVVEVLQAQPKTFGAKTLEASDVLLVLDGGNRPLSPSPDEIATHIERGGSAILALEGSPSLELGKLGELLGVELGRFSIVDDKEHLTTAGGANKQWILTNQFSAHQATRTVGRGSAKAGMVFPTVVALERRDVKGVKTKTLIRSMSASFEDVNGDGRFDGKETRGRRTIAAAFERGESRVIIYGDAMWASDQIIRSVPLSQALLADGLSWVMKRDPFLAGADSDVQRKHGGKGPRKDGAVNYPPRPRSPLNDAPVWKIAPDSITAIEYQRSNVTVSIKREAKGWNAVEKRTVADAPRVETLPLTAEAAAKLVAGWAELSPIKRLRGTAADYELDRSEETIIVRADKDYTLILGGPIYGGSDRYASLPDNPAEVFVLDRDLLRALQTPRVGAANKLVELDREAIDRIEVKRGGQVVSSKKKGDGSWDGPAPVAGEMLLEQLVRARLTRFEEPPADTEVVAEIALSAGNKTTVVTMLRAGDDVFAKSESTRLTGKMRRLSAERLLSTLQDFAN